MTVSNANDLLSRLTEGDIHEAKLTRKQIREVGSKINSTEARFLCDYYYIAQRDRIRTDNQIRSMTKDQEPNLVLQFLSSQSAKVEDLCKKALDDYTIDHPVGAWMRTIHGIGPVTSAALLAHLDINRAPTAGAFWRYAGISGTEVWEKGQKRPWNAELKKICFLIGESFVKVSGNENAFYGQLYKKRKLLEIERNMSGAFAEQARNQLASKNYRDGTVTRARLETGKLSDAQIHARARRYAVKMFLSHLHEVMYITILGKNPPVPFAIAHLDHVHRINVPNPDKIRDFVEPVDIEDKEFDNNKEDN